MSRHARASARASCGSGRPSLAVVSANIIGSIALLFLRQPDTLDRSPPITGRRCFVWKNGDAGLKLPTDEVPSRSPVGSSSNRTASSECVALVAIRS